MTILSRLKRAGRMVTADTIALLTYGVVGIAFTLFGEIGAAEITGRQWIGLRILFNSFRLAGTQLELCSQLTDSVRQWLLGTSTHRIRRTVADGIAVW